MLPPRVNSINMLMFSFYAQKNALALNFYFTNNITPNLHMHSTRSYASTFMIHFLHQRAQSRGPREGPMRLENMRKNGDFKTNIVTIGLFSQKHWISINFKKNSSYLMRPASSGVAKNLVWGCRRAILA
jgi:hypothetical protein